MKPLNGKYQLIITNTKNGTKRKKIKSDASFFFQIKSEPYYQKRLETNHLAARKDKSSKIMKETPLPGKR